MKFDDNRRLFAAHKQEILHDLDSVPTEVVNKVGQLISEHKMNLEKVIEQIRARLTHTAVKRQSNKSIKSNCVLSEYACSGPESDSESSNTERN